MSEPIEKSNVVSFAAIRKAKQGGVQAVSEEMIGMYPLFAAVSMLLYFQYMNRHPNAVWELNKVTKEALALPNPPLYVEMSVATLEAINSIRYSEILKDMHRMSMDEITKYAEKVL